MKVIFMGTPQFAAPALKKLIESEHEIVGVYTKMPKPAGRGFKETKSAIQHIAEENNLPLFTPKNFKDPRDVEQLKSLNPDVIVVAAYGLILTQESLDIPKHCCLNIHPSSLPRWRGAAPIQRTVFSGDKETSVCIMRMDAGLDTGDVIIQKKFPLEDDVTSYKLHDYCAELGAKLTLDAIEQLDDGSAIFSKQLEDGLVYAEKLTKADEKINFTDDGFKISCQIRALTPKPAAYFEFKGEVIKIIEADYERKDHEELAGTVIDDNFVIAVNGGYLKPKLVQRQGKKMIYTDAFLRGFKVEKGDVLG